MPSVSIPTATIVAMSMAGAATGVSAYSAHAAGQATKAEDTMRARQAGLDAGAKQIDIRQKMMRALASQNAQAGQGGIGTGGSFGANINRQLGENKLDLQTLSANSSMQQQLFTEQGNSAATAGNIQAGASLLDMGAKQIGVAQGS